MQSLNCMHGLFANYLQVAWHKAKIIMKNFSEQSESKFKILQRIKVNWKNWCIEWRSLLVPMRLKKETRFSTVIFAQKTHREKQTISKYFLNSALLLTKVWKNEHSAEGMSFPRLPKKYQCYKRISQLNASIRMARFSGWPSLALMLAAQETIFLPASVQSYICWW